MLELLRLRLDLSKSADTTCTLEDLGNLIRLSDIHKFLLLSLQVLSGGLEAMGSYFFAELFSSSKNGAGIARHLEMLVTESEVERSNLL